MYWCDGYNNKVEQMTYEGAGRTVIVEEAGSHYFDIAFSAPSLYLTDWKSRYGNLIWDATYGYTILIINPKIFIKIPTHVEYSGHMLSITNHGKIFNK